MSWTRPELSAEAVLDILLRVVPPVSPQINSSSFVPHQHRIYHPSQLFGVLISPHLPDPDSSFTLRLLIFLFRFFSAEPWRQFSQAVRDEDERWAGRRSETSGDGDHSGDGKGINGTGTDTPIAAEAQEVAPTGADAVDPVTASTTATLGEGVSTPTPSAASADLSSGKDVSGTKVMGTDMKRTVEDGREPEGHKMSMSSRSLRRMQHALHPDRGTTVAVQYDIPNFAVSVFCVSVRCGWSCFLP